MTAAAAIFGTLALVLSLVAAPVYLALTAIAQALHQAGDDVGQEPGA